METESEYPYKGKDVTCKYSKSKATNVEVSTYKNVTPKSVSQMKAAVAIEPTSVSVDAAGRQFMNY